ncbi:MAG: acyltransferase family protein [Sphingobacteriales bacterium]|nr:acyltransferase family protein [Sphingobacteriales bacterium]
MNSLDTTQPTKEHFYYLDWLRVIAFSILLLEHSAEVFTNWNFWIKNNETSQFLSYFVAFFLPWRMPLLFIISGAAITLSFKRRNVSEVFMERVKRLLFPLLVAIFLVIPPQLYFIRAFKGNNEGFLEFLTNILTLKLNWSINGNIHYLHLWYLAFVFAYSILLLPLLSSLKTDKGKELISKISTIICNPYCLFSLGILLTFPFYLVKQFHVSNTIAIFFYYFPFFIFGSVFATNKSILQAIKQHSTNALILAMVITANFYIFSIIEDNPHAYFLNYGKINSAPHLLLKSMNQWFWVIGLFGLSMRFLNKGSNVLSYATKAVYPFYIFHQTIIIAVAYYVVQISAPLSVKLIVIIFFTFFVILILYEYFLKRNPITQFMFGIKVNISKREALVSSPDQITGASVNLNNQNNRQNSSDQIINKHTIAGQ